MARRRSVVRVALAGGAAVLALVGAACTSDAADGGRTSSTSDATTTTALATTTTTTDLSPAAQRWIELREDNDCQGYAFGSLIDDDMEAGTIAGPDWPEARRVVPVAREYAEIKQEMIDAVEAEGWPPDAQAAIDEQLEVQRVRVAWLRQVGAATTVDELNAAFRVTLPSDRSPAVRYALDIPPFAEQHSSYSCTHR